MHVPGLRGGQLGVNRDTVQMFGKQYRNTGPAMRPVGGLDPWATTPPG